MTSTVELLGLRTFLNGSHEDFQKSAGMLLGIFANLLRGIREKNCRMCRLNMSARAFVDQIISVPGALDMLFEAGFQEDPISNEHLEFPSGTQTELVKFCRNQIQKEIIRRSLPRELSVQQNLLPEGFLLTEYITRTTTQQQPRPSTSSSSRAPKMPKNNSAAAQSRMYSVMLSSLKQVARYEDPELQRRVLRTIPVQRLKEEAQRAAVDEENSAQNAFVIRTFLLHGLLKWFKGEFFVWVNNPNCSSCNSETSPAQQPLQAFLHLLQPTPEEARHDVTRVELYSCNTCHNMTRFARFNDPVKLLETRRGRCGEWANCFTAVCRALGFEARFVQDNADHVWTEVFSELEQRWIHCDSCEAALDQPLIYESGWGKKLAYIFAFSRDEVVDVSWRYSANHTDLLLRRVDVPEKWLMATMQKLSNRLQEKYSVDRRSVLLRRRCKEITEFMMPRNAKSDEMVGRTSGSLTWRLARGELGSAKPREQLSYIIRPSTEELDQGVVRIVYRSSRDAYIRQSNETKGYSSMTFCNENVARKVEQDWKMAYLARTPGSDNAQIGWKLSCDGTEKFMKSIQLEVPKTTYQSGIIRVSVEVDGAELVSFATTASEKLEFGDLNCKNVVIRVNLTAGDGANAWQHTQLFREPLDGKEVHPFVIEAKLG